jgi:hypothetical protein
MTVVEGAGLSCNDSGLSLFHYDKNIVAEGDSAGKGQRHKME